MSHSILRLERLKSPSDISGIQKHVQRETKNYANKDIQKELSGLNYDLINTEKIDYNEKIKNRIEKGYTGKRKIRNDAIKLVDGIITSDNKFFEGMDQLDTKDFFEHAFEFIKNEFGEENIMYATVHFDEKTPHMHFGFVPLTEDGRLSAKEVVGNKKDLSQRQTKFNDFLNSKGYELKRGESAFISKRKHLETSEYKNKTAYHKKQLDNVKRDLEHEFERLEHLKGIRPGEERKRQQKKDYAILEVPEVKVGAFNRINPTELDNLRTIVQKAVEIAEKQQEIIDEKEEEIAEYVDLNRQLHNAMKQQQKFEEKRMNEVNADWSEAHDNLKKRYESLTHGISEKVERRAEELKNERFDELKKENALLRMEKKELESVRESHADLHEEKQDLKEKLHLAVEDNERLQKENNKLREGIEHLKWRFNKLWDVSKEYLEIYAKDGIKTIRSWFKEDTGEEIKFKQQKRRKSVIVMI